MADDRYNWLDNDAAERLLRGEPVGTTAPGAPELARLLADAAPAGPGAAPLPGEEAALAAFRRARNDVPARPGARAPSRGRAGIARPFRRGFVVALAACALGGVAVAAGTGVLPSPFRPGPAPATSVSTDATPGALESPDASGTTAPGTPDATAGERPTGPATVSPTPGSSHGATVPPSSGASRSPGRAVPGDGENGSAERRAVVLALCRDYEAGKRGAMDRETVQRLERAAGGPAKIHAFCRRYLQQQGNGDGSDGGDGSGTGGENGHGGGGGGNAGGGQGGGKGGGDEDDDGQPPTAPGDPDPAPSSPAPDVPDPAPTPSPGTASPASAVSPGAVSPARAASPDARRPVAV
ncbi:hypothetical protein ACGH2B_09155 [Streptomyces sp. BBFR2]|uniref:hypothetical protein n=1 Tax=Streptomyces sp. BBFR2 TaxID=3372854 RepID=UPI0037DA4B67